MKELIDKYRSGTSTQRLAIIADLTSLLGVSAAAVATTLFSIGRSVNVGNVVFATAQSLLFLGGLAIFCAAYWLVDKLLSTRFNDAHFPRKMFRIAIACLFASLAIIAGYAFYEYLDSFIYIRRRA